MRPLVCLLFVLTASAAPVAADAPERPERPELKTWEEIRDCVSENGPVVANIQSVSMTSKDAVGNERVVYANIYARHGENGERRVLARFRQPEELEGTAFLFIEQNGQAELIVRSPDLPGAKRIAGRELLGSIVGTDFSYEDFLQLQNLNRPRDPKLLPPQEINLRPVYVIEASPASPEYSAYERVVSFVDKDTCLITRVELYEPGHKLRKVMTAPPDRFRNLDSVWMANEVFLEDVRDGTQTRVVVESFDVGAEVPESAFSIESLDQEKPTLDAPRPKAPAIEPDLVPPEG